MNPDNLTPIMYAHYETGGIPINRQMLDDQIALGNDVDDFYQRVFYEWINPSKIGTPLHVS